MKTLDSLSLGYAGAIISALCMLLLGILGALGLYTGAITMMSDWHMYFSLSLSGIIGGIIEAMIISFIFFYSFAIVYNWLVTKKTK